MTKMYVTKTADDLYHVEVRDPFTHEEVNGSQFLGMARTLQPGCSHKDVASSKRCSSMCE
jgi:hypothetical protein